MSNSNNQTRNVTRSQVYEMIADSQHRIVERMQNHISRAIDHAKEQIMEEMKHSIDRLWELSSISFSSLEKKIEESISAERQAQQRIPNHESHNNKPLGFQDIINRQYQRLGKVQFKSRDANDLANQILGRNLKRSRSR